MQAKPHTLLNHRSLTARRLMETSFILIAIWLGAVQAWHHRFGLASEDIVSYLDIADAYRKGAWDAAVNGTWSPLYSVCLALAQAVLGWVPALDACRVKLVNFVFFLFALACFRFFLHNLSRFNRRCDALEDETGNAAALPPLLLIAGGYVLFLWSALHWTGLYCDTPDMSTAAFVYLASGILLRILRHPDGWLNFAFLGAALGFGYLSKAALFPLSFVFIAAAASTRTGIGRTLSSVCIALSIFTLVAAPHIAALSSAKGRFTFSETGKLSYAWWVNPGMDVLPDHHWQGGPAEIGTPLHPTREIHRDPSLFEFAEPIGGTYPPWTDPSYWYDGIRVRLTAEKLWSITLRNLAFYFRHFLSTLLGGFVLLAVAGGRLKRSVSELARHFRILLPAAAGLGVYLMTTDFALNTIPRQPSMRYITPFVVMLFAIGFAAVRTTIAPYPRRLSISLACIGLLFAASILGLAAIGERNAFRREKPVNDHFHTAQMLNAFGILPGYKVAVIGSEVDYIFWARLARVKIIAQIPDSAAFFSKDDATRASILRLIEGTGANAVVWKTDDEDGYFPLLFHRTE